MRKGFFVFLLAMSMCAMTGCAGNRIKDVDVDRLLEVKEKVSDMIPDKSPIGFALDVAEDALEIVVGEEKAERIEEFFEKDSKKEQSNVSKETVAGVTETKASTERSQIEAVEKETIEETEEAQIAETTAVETTAIETTAEATQSHPIESMFPSDWAGRYIIKTEKNGVSVYCKLAAESPGMNDGWMFSIYHMVDDTLTLPDYYEMGMYEGKPVHFTCPSDVYMFEDKTVEDEYRRMVSEIRIVCNRVEEKLEELNDEAVSETTTDTVQETIAADLYDISNYNVPEVYGNMTGITGVYRLISSEWSEESKSNLLHPNNQHAFMSIAADGTLYVKRGREMVTGKAMVHKDYKTFTDADPFFVLVFDNGKVHYATMLQGVMTVADMETYTCRDGRTSEKWAFIHEDDDWWTEESLRGDIG